jgi:hypothetical protein
MGRTPVVEKKSLEEKRKSQALLSLYLSSLLKIEGVGIHYFEGLPENTQGNQSEVYTGNIRRLTIYNTLTPLCSDPLRPLAPFMTYAQSSVLLVFFPLSPLSLDCHLQ